MTSKFDIIPISDWFPQIETPLIIAGPCSAESREQLLNTATQISENKKVKILRAGVWKPRTRPGSFEGIGEEALVWLKEAKEKTGLLTAVEVANPQHIELCKKYDVDIVWIGARTVANPFSVQELADNLKDTNIPVLVKNPINPDIELWIGALERMNKAGVKKLAAIHRGFYPFEHTVFRNIPKWEIPIELKRRFENFPIICDPSHISGKSEFVTEISQKALDLDMDGLMIETHCTPEKALSDARQQITPNHLKTLIENLNFRKKSVEDKELNSIMELYREQIDSFDTQMLELLSQRMKIVEKIGLYKKQHNITILQLKRWEKIIKSRTEQGKQMGLSPEFVLQLLKLVHKEAINRQDAIMKEDSSSFNS